MSSKWAQVTGAAAAASAGSDLSAPDSRTTIPGSCELDEESIKLANSLQEPKSLQSTSKPSAARRMLVPFGRSSTLKSGSLQDLKFANQAASSNQISRQQQQQQQQQLHLQQTKQQATASSNNNDQQQQQQQQQQGFVRPKLLRQRSSKTSSSNALADVASGAQQQQQQQQQPGRNAFRSSKSMLLLAQNQHIPQATAQLESFMSKQQADFINYAQYASAAAAAAAGQNQQEWAVHQQQQQQQQQQQNQQLHQALGYNQHASDHAQLGLLLPSSGSNQSISYHQSQPMIMSRQYNHQAAMLSSGSGSGSQQLAVVDRTSTTTNVLSSEQCNEQDNEDRPNCMQIMKKLFFSLVLGTIIAICWVMIIHTLKWIAIRGSEFELLQQQHQQQQQQLALQSGAVTGSNYNNNKVPPDSSNPNDENNNIYQANLLLAHQAIQVQQEHPGRRQPSATAAAASLGANETSDLFYARASNGTTVASAATTMLAGGDQAATFVSAFDEQQGRRRRGTSASAAGAASRAESSVTTNGTPIGRRKRVRANEDADSDYNFDKSKATMLASSIEHADEQQQGNRDLTTAKAREKQRRVTVHAGDAATDDSPQASAAAAASARRAKPQARHQTLASVPLRTSGELGDENDDLSSSSPADGAEHETPLSTLASGDDSATVGGVGGAMILPEHQDQHQPQLDLTNRQASEQVAAPTSTTTAGTDAGNFLYRAPFFTSWFVSVWNILFMPVFTLISSCCFRNEDSTTKKLLVESISQFMDNGLTTLQFLGRCAFFSVLWIGTIFGIVHSLTYLDATVVMALFACSAALVYLLSWVLLHQQFVGVRIVAVIICTTGIALLAYMDNSRTLGSVLIVAGSALCSAVYKVIYQRMFGFWSIAQMSLFFTLIGLFNAFLMWPLALLLYFLGVELIVWRHIPWIHLTVASALHLTANIVAYFGPICSYDIFLTMGLLLAVVLSAVIDVTFYKITFFGMKLAGVLLLMIGFLVCLLPENWNEYLYDLANERFVRWKKQRSMKKSRNKVQDMSTGQMSRLRTPSGRVK